MCGSYWLLGEAAVGGGLDDVHATLLLTVMLAEIRSIAQLAVELILS
jgi:hypothetical protein